ncbi:MAG: hypothetical protein IPO83_07060 [Chitinophagaceae bacterium]|nr:hypothetical protein [Chitinophagaceae bacterium]
MKTPSKSWEEKLSEKMAAYESPVPAGLFNTVIKKREQRKWLANLRKRSRSLWLLLLLLIPFTCHYLNNGTVPVGKNNVGQKEITSENKHSVLLPEAPPLSSDVISLKQSTFSSSEKKINQNNEDAFNKKNVDEKRKSTKNPLVVNSSEESAISGTFYNTSKISQKEKSAGATQQDDSMLPVISTVSQPFQLVESSNKNFNANQSNFETEFIASLPLNAQNLFYENNRTASKIFSEKSSNELIDSTAAIEISQTSWNLHWSLEALFAPDLSFQQLTDQPNDSLTLIDWNKQMEKSFTTGVRFSLNFDVGLFMKSGLLYSTEQSSFTLQKNWEVAVITDSTYFYTIWSPFKDPVQVFFSDTVISSTDSLASYASSITYSYWNIPLLIGYTFELQKFQISAQSGVILNASFAQKGSSINPETLEPVTLPESGTSFFRNRAALSYYAGIESEYRFNEHIGIFAEPYFQIQLKPITGDAAPVEQQLHKFGLNTGIKFSF